MLPLMSITISKQCIIRHKFCVWVARRFGWASGQSWGKKERSRDCSFVLSAMRTHYWLIYRPPQTWESGIRTTKAEATWVYQLQPIQTWVLLLCASLSTSFLFRFFCVCVCLPPPPSLSLTHTQEDKRQKALDSSQRPKLNLGAEEPKREL
jgi:hypothetical protein